jgi:hypothetical protein
MTEKQLVSDADMSPATRTVVNLLARIDQSLTGKDDQTVWHTVRNQMERIEDIVLGRDVYYLSDGGMSRLSLDCTSNSLVDLAFVTSNSMERVKWLWNHETSLRVQLRRALVAWVVEYERKAASA